MVFSESVRKAMITRCVTASISALSSLLLTIFIWNSPKGCKSPYSRIIFGLSIGDVIQSICVLASPFAAPSSPTHIFGTGSTQSCDAVGFFLIVGSVAVPWYTLFLTFYFLKRVKYRLTPQKFAKREEKWLHILIWVYSFVVGFYSLAKKQINPTQGGSLCYLTASPVGCEVTEGQECTRGDGAQKTVAFTVIASVITVFVALFVVLGAFTLHVFLSEKQLQPTKKNKTKALTSLRIKKEGSSRIEPHEHVKVNDPNENVAQNEGAFLVNNIQGEEIFDPITTQDLDETKEDEEASNQQEDAFAKYAKQAMDLKLTKSAVIQSSLYILAFFFVYCGPIIALVTGITHSETFFWMISIFYPLGGLFNMIIYTRPKVKAVRKVLPDIPRPIGFIVVLLSGGETPNLIDIIGQSNENNGPEGPPSGFNSAFYRLFGIDPSVNLDAEIEQAMRDEGNVEKLARELQEREEKAMVKNRATI